MPSIKKTKPGKKHTKLFAALLILLLVTCVVLSYMVYSLSQKNTKLHNENQSALRLDLEQSGRALDRFADTLTANGIPAENNRSNYCYQPGRKSGTPPNYCTQKLAIELPYTEDAEEVFQRANILMMESFLDIRKTDWGYESESGRRNDYDIKSAHPNGGCTGRVGIIYTTRITISVDCVSGDFDTYIYPKSPHSQ